MSEPNCLDTSLSLHCSPRRSASLHLSAIAYLVIAFQLGMLTPEDGMRKWLLGCSQLIADRANEDGYLEVSADFVVTGGKADSL